MGTDGSERGGAAEPASAEELTTALLTERERVTARMSALQRDLDDIIERSFDSSRDDEHDPEGATIAFERAQVSALLDAAHAKLEDVQRAEERVAGGEHHRCSTCGATIPRERQLARPTTRTCVACA